MSAALLIAESIECRIRYLNWLSWWEGWFISACTDLSVAGGAYQHKLWEGVRGRAVFEWVDGRTED